MPIVSNQLHVFYHAGILIVICGGISCLTDLFAVGVFPQ